MAAAIPCASAGEAESDFNEGGEIKGYTFTVNIDKDAAEMAIHADGLQIWSRGEEISNHYISWGETEYFVPKEYITGILRTPVRSTGEDVRLALSAPGVSCPTPIAWSWENYESAAVIPLLDRGGVKIAPAGGDTAHRCLLQGGRQGQPGRAGYRPGYGLRRTE